jgi:hypothetical protein
MGRGSKDEVQVWQARVQPGDYGVNARLRCATDGGVGRESHGILIG